MMTDKRSIDRAGSESAKLWLEQRKQKTSATASFAPHTPPAQRSVSTFSSPGSILGKEEDVVIIELTPRYLLAGIEGESGPQCRIDFGPDNNRRVGDYRIWMPGYKRRTEKLESWGREYELWRNDVRDIDLGLLSDMLERAVREAYLKHLLVDTGTGRLVLVLPSIVPLPVIETILSTLFQRWKYPHITLLPSPTMALASAGLRSGLVVDIGWEETIVTSIYEYREIASSRSTRAMKLLTKQIATLFMEKCDSQAEQHSLRFDLDFVEQVLVRATATTSTISMQDSATDVSSSPIDSTNGHALASANEPEIEIEWPGILGSQNIKLSRQELSRVLSEILLGGLNDTHPDDDEIAIPQLMFQLLLSLPPDVRGVCMARIVFTGHTPVFSFLRPQIIEEVSSLIQKEGWSSIKGKHASLRDPVSNGTAQSRSRTIDARHYEQIPADKDYVDERLQKQKAKFAQPNVSGSLREIHTLGSWVGASLLTSLKVRAFVEVERERFISHGLSGASRDTEISVVPQQRMSSFGKPNDRNSWTLGGWG